MTIFDFFFAKRNYSEDKFINFDKPKNTYWHYFIKEQKFTIGVTLIVYIVMLLLKNL